MGFGLLVIGYTMMLAINGNIGVGFDAFPDVIGYILFLLGLRNLRPYSKNFVFAWYLTIPLIAIGGVIFGAQVISLFGLWHEQITALLSYIEIVHYPVLIIFHIYLCLGIKELANEVGLPKIVNRSYTAMVLTTVTYLLQLIHYIKVPVIVALISFVLVYFTYFYMLYYLYSCYARIVYADEEGKSIPNPLMTLLEKKQNKKK